MGGAIVSTDELIAKLKAIAESGQGDQETDHVDADRLLLEYINNAEVTKAFDAISKWYA